MAIPDAPRRKSDAALIGVLLTMLLQFGGLVWGAAKLSAAVDELRRITSRLEAAEAQRTQVEQSTLERVRVLEIRVDGLDSRIQGLEEYHR